MKVFIAWGRVAVEDRRTRAQAGSPVLRVWRGMAERHRVDDITIDYYQPYVQLNTSSDLDLSSMRI